ncbi:MAG TPA: DUF4105 domain-containing protein [Gemmatimonadaceae bacterium]|nr:DUF4105 domain-containing protein [Gemmatimonadaceae bacterium]
MRARLVALCIATALAVTVAAQARAQRTSSPRTGEGSGHRAVLGATPGAVPVAQPVLAPRGDSARGPVVSLITIGPGSAVWERFGHNAIRVRDDAHGVDVSYNWGLFDFRQPHFVQRFILGRPLYAMGGFDTDQMIAAYRTSDRSIWEQELALSPRQVRRLIELLRENSRPENVQYLYDYFRDNCSTRARDALNVALDGQLRRAVEPHTTAATYRSETRRLMEGDAPMYTAIMIGLGPSTDRALDAWQLMFIPMRMRDALRTMTVSDESGETHPLVRAERVIYRSTRAPEPAAVGVPVTRYALVGALVGVAIVLLSRIAARGARWARISAASAMFAWSVLCGFLGTLLLFGWFFTNHVVMRGNQNVLLFTPISLVIAALLPFAFTRARTARAVRRLAGASAILAWLALVAHAIPGPGQSNMELIMLALPVHLAVAWGITLLPLRAPSGDQTPAPVPAPVMHG